MEIKQTKNRFYVGEADRPTAHLDYREIDEHTVEAYHTVVRPELQGQGIAKKLLDRFMEYVKANDLKVVASCSYVDVKMREDAEYDKYLER